MRGEGGFPLSKQKNQNKFGQFPQASRFLAGHVGTLAKMLDDEAESAITSIEVTFAQGEFRYSLTLDLLNADQLERVCQAAAQALATERVVREGADNAEAEEKS
jgi:hypothetical protein